MRQTDIQLVHIYQSESEETGKQHLQEIIEEYLVSLWERQPEAFLPPQS